MLDRLDDVREELGSPNRLESATAFELLGSLLPAHFRTDVVPALLSSVYLRNQGSHDGEQPQQQQQQQGPASLRALLEQDTYFMQFTRLRSKLALLEEEVRTCTQLEQTMQREMLKKKMLLEKTTSRWQRSLMSSSFYLWKNTLASMKRQREILNTCFARISKSKAREIVRGWHVVAGQEKKERALEKIQEMDSRYKALEVSKAELDLQIKVAGDAVGDWNDQLTELHVAATEVKAQLLDVDEELEPLEAKRDIAASVAEAWFGLCDCLVQQEIAMLRQHLAEVAAASFQDPEHLVDVDGGGQLDALLEAPVDELLLRWVRYHLRRSSSLSVENFSSDLHDGAAYAALLEALGACPDPREQDEDALAYVARALPHFDSIQLSRQELCCAAADRNLALLASLFCNHPGLQSEQPSWADASAALDAASSEQAALAATLAQDTVHVLRSAETWNHLVGRIEEVRRKVRWLLRERDQKISLWNNVRKRVQSVAWRVMLARTRGAAVPVPDHKEAREVRLFASVSHYASTKREDDAVSNVLSSSFRSLRDAFCQYNAFSLHSSHLRAAAARDLVPLHAHGFLCLCKELGVALAPQVLVDIVRAEATADGTNAGAMVTEGGEAYVGPQRFVRCLARVADRLHAGHSAAANLARFLGDKVDRATCFGATKPNKLRRKLWGDSAARAVVCAHAAPLRDVFDTFAAPFIPGDKIHVCAAALGVVSPAFSSADLAQACDVLQLKQGAFFLDFIELVALAATYRGTNVFVPFHQHLQDLIAHILPKPPAPLPPSGEPTDCID